MFICPLILNPLEPRVPLSGLNLNENASFVKFMMNLDAKYEFQMCGCTLCN